MDYENARTALLAEVKKSLMGPGGQRISGWADEEEILNVHPLRLYSTGVLHSEKSKVAHANNEEDDANEERLEDSAVESEEAGSLLNPTLTEGSTVDDEALRKTAGFASTAMGLTFYHATDLSSTVVDVRGGKYALQDKSLPCFVVVDKALLPLPQELLDVLSNGGLRLEDDRIIAGVSGVNIGEFRRAIGEFIDHVLNANKDAAKGTRYEKRWKNLGYLIGFNKFRHIDFAEELAEHPKLVHLVHQIFFTNRFVEYLAKAKKRAYKRTPIEIVGVSLESVMQKPEGFRLAVDNMELLLRARVISQSRERGKLISLFLVNESKGDHDQLFQAKLSVTSAVKSIQAFPTLAFQLDDEEANSLELLYRFRPKFALGHGCSVYWKPTEEDVTSSISSTFFPECEVSPLDWRQEVYDDALAAFLQEVLQFKLLSVEEQWSETLGKLVSIPDNYERWIILQAERIESIPMHLKETAEKHLQRCREAALRIRSGITALKDPQVGRAFRLANRAMLMVRCGGHKYTNGQISAKKEEGQTWRPFQLAFFLVAIESLANPHSSYRKIVDLLWVPTGGGKTEAYLGLVAFTLFLDRLRGNEEDAKGVKVLMRYTLRLLTTQQFQRASSLISACEYIRSSEVDLGDTRITIGLWIGSKSIPNNFADMKKEVKDLKDPNRKAKNPVPILACPWCNTDILQVQQNAKQRSVECGYCATDSSFMIECLNEDCHYNPLNGECLPIQVVDDGLYKNPPSLLFATVDKFAMLPWKPEVARFFGIDPYKGKRIAPSPSLIIQDELHLLTSELGSIVGIYETILNELIRYDGSPPKIVASTATARQTEEQCRGLYHSDGCRQFPPPGLRFDDSYFVREDKSRPGRKYVALLPEGSPTAMKARVFGAVLQASIEAPMASDEVRDQYFTLVSYFNSLRALGTAESLLSMDVQENIRSLGVNGRGQFRQIREHILLYSRSESSEIPQLLKRLEDEKIGAPKVVDIVLATNMLSVGIDIDRFGLMLVSGHPKSTAEYIQATSRVGRKNPGLVFTLYNSVNVRERSVFEAYQDYLQTIYRHVEPASVTPFTKAVRARAYRAVLVALARLLNPALVDNPASLGETELATALDKLIRIIQVRVSGVDASEEAASLENLNAIKEDWLDLLSALQRSQTYGRIGTDAPEQLLQRPEGKGVGFWPLMTSLRNIDASCDLNILEQT